MGAENEEADLRSGILKCIDSGLGVLGDAPKQIVYSYLAQNQLTKEAILDEPWKFTEALKKLFGRGEEVLERMIVRELKRTFEIPFGGNILVEILAAMRLRKGSEKRQESQQETIKSRKSRARGKV